MKGSDTLQGIWKLENAYIFDRNSGQYRETKIEVPSYFEFRGDQFFTGNFDKDGVVAPGSKSSSFVSEGDILIINADIFKKASWKWEVKHGKLELVAIKPDGNKAKYIFSRFTNSIWSKFKNRFGFKLTWSRILLGLIIVWAIANIFIMFSQYTAVSVYYIKPEIANVRGCESTDCEIIGEVYQSTELTFPYKSIEDMPDWLEINLQDEETGEEQSGYINKIVLSEEQIH